MKIFAYTLLALIVLGPISIQSGFAISDEVRKDGGRAYDRDTRADDEAREANRLKAGSGIEGILSSMQRRLGAHNQKIKELAASLALAGHQLDFESTVSAKFHENISLRLKEIEKERARLASLPRASTNKRALEIFNQKGDLANRKEHLEVELIDPENRVARAQTEVTRLKQTLLNEQKDVEEQKFLIRKLKALAEDQARSCSGATGGVISNTNDAQPIVSEPALTEKDPYSDRGPSGVSFSKKRK